jgi:hypothetical protein
MDNSLRETIEFEICILYFAVYVNICKIQILSNMTTRQLCRCFSTCVRRFDSINVSSMYIFSMFSFLYSICYVEIQPHRVSQIQALTYILFYFTVICIVIKSHQLNQIYSTTLRNFIGCEYSVFQRNILNKLS